MQKQQSNQAKQQRQIGANVTSMVSIAFLAYLMSGCASIISGTEQDLEVKPAGAKIEIYTWDGKSFPSPNTGLETTVTVRRPKLVSLLVRVQKDGYCPRYWLTYPKLNPVVWLNLIGGLGIIGIIIDANNGANASFSPSEFELNMPETQKCGL
jgi:hypothetical protein